MTADDGARFEHARREKAGLLLVNLGTPDAPTAAAVRRYLRQFLSDRRVVDLPRPLWWLILNLAILPWRPRKVAAAYASVWTERGSPLLTHSEDLTAGVSEVLADSQVALAMTYGNPSLDQALRGFAAAGVRDLTVLPLYPQYSATTTAAVFDGLALAAAEIRYLPRLRFINHYCDHPRYIAALANSVQRHWDANGRADRLVFSFHGIPQRFHRLGDPYPCQCRKTVRLVCERLGLADHAWELAFQSRFGREPWLQPYLDQRLMALPGEGIRSVDVICPGFAADCLETLEEVAIANRELYRDHGGEELRYIPALNAHPDHIACLAEVAAGRGTNYPEDTSSAQARLERATAAGAQR